MMQPHGSVRNCQLSFKSDWPPLGATPQILTLKAREKKEERKQRHTSAFSKINHKESYALALFKSEGIKKNTLLTILHV